MSGGEVMEEHLEIERRFFVDQGSEKPWRVLEASSKVIQYYLDANLLRLQGHTLVYNEVVEIIRLGEETRTIFLSEKDWTVRIRFRDERTTLTLKGRRTNATAAELEWNIERDLGDPARLFNELAGDGLNLDEIFGDLSSTATVGTILDTEVPTEEVNEDV